MKPINSLIAKYGEPATLNGAGIVAFVDEENSSRLKKLFKDMTGDKSAVLLVREQVAIEDVFVLKSTEYLVYTASEIRKRGAVLYSEVTIFENDYNKDVKIYDQRINKHGVNLPSIDLMPYREVKARIKTVKASDYIEYSFHNGAAPTHQISVFYDSSIKVDDLIAWKDKRFEIIKMTNTDELDRFLVLDVIEVLNEQ